MYYKLYNMAIQNYIQNNLKDKDKNNHFDIC